MEVLIQYVKWKKDLCLDGIADLTTFTSLSLPDWKSRKKVIIW